MGFTAYQQKKEAFLALIALLGNKALPKRGLLFNPNIAPRKAKIVYYSLTLLHSERPKLYAILAFLNAVGLKTEFDSREAFHFPL